MFARLLQRPCPAYPESENETDPKAGPNSPLLRAVTVPFHTVLRCVPLPAVRTWVFSRVIFPNYRGHAGPFSVQAALTRTLWRASPVLTAVSRPVQCLSLLPALCMWGRILAAHTAALPGGTSARQQRAWPWRWQAGRGVRSAPRAPPRPCPAPSSSSVRALASLSLGLLPWKVGLAADSDGGTK